MPDERRKHKRFQIQNGTIAVLTPPWPLSTIVCDLLDISPGGVTIRYVPDGRPSGRPNELAIACGKHRFHLGKLPIETVSDHAVTSNSSGSTVGPRRLGLEFGELTQDQISQLKAFISNHIRGEE